MSILLTIVGTVAALVLLGWLASCAGAERWITLREWWGDSDEDVLG